MKKYNMKKEKSQEIRYISSTVQNMKVIDIVEQTFEPACHIKRISKELYMKGRYDKEGNFITDGEVFSVKQKEDPMRNRRSLKRIFKDLRQRIAHNFSGGLNELFVTLTYRGEEQTNDPKKIHTDFKKFWRTLSARYSAADLSYISIVEPHASGKFHIHVLLLAKGVEHLYIPFTELEEIWGHGNAKVERLEDIDHMGAYFIAYFTNLELDDEEAAKYEAADDVIEKNGKKYIKGKRLDYYPDGMQIARCSRDLPKPPKVVGLEALETTAGITTLVYEHTTEIPSVDKYGHPKTAKVTTKQYKRYNPYEKRG